MRLFEPKTVRAKLRYHDLPGRGIPIVFLHGMGCASSFDYPQVAADGSLRARRRILIDLLGSGYSDRPARFRYTVDAHARIVVEFVRRLKLKRVCLYGHSMSGPVAIVAAKLSPSSVARLVLSEPNLDPGGGATSRAIARQSIKRYVSRGHAGMVRIARQQGNDGWATTMVGSMPEAIHQEAVSLVKGGRPSWRQILAKLPMPRTVIFGAHSLPDPDTRALLKIGVRVRVVPRAGHNMAVENPAGLARAIAASTI